MYFSLRHSRSQHGASYSNMIMLENVLFHYHFTLSLHTIYLLIWDLDLIQFEWVVSCIRLVVQGEAFCCCIWKWKDKFLMSSLDGGYIIFSSYLWKMFFDNSYFPYLILHPLLQCDSSILDDIHLLMFAI